jgi:hypothetical protein
MDLVRLEDAVEMSIIFEMVIVGEAGGVVVPGRSRADVPPSFERDERSKFTEGHAARDAAHFWLDLQYSS